MLLEYILLLMNQAFIASGAEFKAITYRRAKEYEAVGLSIFTKEVETRLQCGVICQQRECVAYNLIQHEASNYSCTPFWCVTGIIHTGKNISNAYTTISPGVTNLTDVSCVSDNSTQLTVSWKPPAYYCSPSFARFVLNWTDVNFPDISLGDLEITGRRSHVIEQLIPCTNYTISIALLSIINWEGNITTSDPASTATAVPGKVTNVTRASSTPFSLALKWDRPPDNPCTIHNYTLTWTKADDELDMELNITETTYNITDLVPCTEYNITVTAYTEKGPGEPSSAINFTTGTYVSGENMSISQISLSPYSLEVSWSSDFGTPCLVINFAVIWTKNADNRTKHEAIDITESPYNITDLAPNTNYTITVIPYTDEGPGIPSQNVSLVTGTLEPVIEFEVEVVMKEILNITRAMEQKINILEIEVQSLRKGCPEGLFLFAPSNQCFKMLNDTTRNWDDANTACRAMGLVLAHPYDPVAIRDYIITKYGDYTWTWIGARGTGSGVQFQRSSRPIGSSNPLWLRRNTATSQCVAMLTTAGDWKAHGDHLYYSYPCNYGAWALCELARE